MQPLRRRDAGPAGTRLVAVPTRLADLADARAGVLTRDQLRDFGIGRDQVRAAISARRWQAIGRRVVVLDNAPLTLTQRQWAAVQAPNQLCVLAGLSAAIAGGLRGFATERVHLVVRGSCGAALPMWVRLHNSRRFAARDVHPASGPPRTRIARSIVDAAAWSVAARQACAILCAGVQQRLVSAGALSAELERAGAVRHGAILRAVLGDIAGGGHTLAELDLGPLARRAGLPRPRRQALRREPDGRVRYVDAEFDLPDGTVLAVEIDGAVHLKPLEWWGDMSRQNELVIRGQPVLRFDSITLRLRPNQVVDQLRRMRFAHA